MSLTTLKILCLSGALLSCSSVLAGLVNINKADGETLAHHLKGVGEKKAEAIVLYRNTHGVFTDVKDLVNVKGIGEGLLKKNLEDLSLTQGAVVMNPKGKTARKGKLTGKKPAVVGKTDVSENRVVRSGKITTKIAKQGSVEKREVAKRPAQ
ncbi:MAG: hypothetical protein CSB47_01155 [Proteobacteria bacterium]|nr:MAG: hypothetical protein CSB47_01155 [Pseudomonadota bacterium]